MTLRRLIIASLLCSIALATTACKSPCDKLADRLCQLAGDDTEQCAKWQARAKRVPTETCESGLRQLDRDRVR